MSQPAFVSHAQNGEDVVLWRALRDVGPGRYVEVGANDPTELSITRAFYDRGWSGVTVDPVSGWARRHAEQRPRDTFVEAAVTETDGGTVTFYEVPGTGLSTLDPAVVERHRTAGHEVREVTVPARRLDAILAEAGLDGHDIHFMVVDTEGSEGRVLAGIDLARWRPWVLVVESTVPLGTAQTHREWEPALLEAGYVFRLFDGVSRFYVAREHDEHLGRHLSYPACALDDYVPARLAEAEARVGELTATRDDLVREVLRWRTEALSAWVGAAQDTRGTSSEETAALHRQIAELARDLTQTRATLSWRITRPLRQVAQLARRAR